jgi:hypothetical protein
VALGEGFRVIGAAAQEEADKALKAPLKSSKQS